MDDRYLATSGSNGVPAFIWFTQNWTTIQEFNDQANCKYLWDHNGDLLFTPDGKWLQIGDEFLKVSTWEMDWKLPDGQICSKPFGINLIGNILLQGCDDGTMAIYNYSEKKLITKVIQKSEQMNIYTASISPDGKFIISVGNDDVVRLWGILNNN